MRCYPIAPLLLIGLLFWLGACSAPADRPAERRDGAVVVARANDETLTLEELDELIPPEYQEYYRLEDLKGLVRRWVETELVYQEAVERGIDREPGIRTKVEEFRRLLLENEILQRELGSRVRVTDSEVEEYYHDNSDFFLREHDEVRLSQIVVDSLELASSLRERLLGDPRLFAALAEEYSLDSSGKDGGDVGYYAVDELIDPLNEAVIGLNVGEVSPVISVPGYGHFIMTVTDRKGAGTMKALEEVEDEIRDIIMISREEEEKEKWVERLREEADVEINWAVLEERHDE